MSQRHTRQRRLVAIVLGGGLALAGLGVAAADMPPGPGKQVMAYPPGPYRPAAADYPPGPNQQAAAEFPPGPYKQAAADAVGPDF
jgi:hypothetical protein